MGVVGAAVDDVDGGALIVMEVVGVGADDAPYGFPLVVVVGVGVGVVVGFGVGAGVGRVQRRAISLSSSMVTRAASTLATSMPVVTWAW